MDDVALPDGTRLSGRLDKVEFATPWDGRSSVAVNVVDYKTKAPMSRNAILGRTASATGNEWRQLLFYRLLLDRWRGGVMCMERGEVDFLEPNAAGKYKKEQFDITASLADEFQRQVGDVAAKIRALAFWNERCNDRECPYCNLRELMG